MLRRRAALGDISISSMIVGLNGGGVVSLPACAGLVCSLLRLLTGLLALPVAPGILSALGWWFVGVMAEDAAKMLSAVALDLLTSDGVGPLVDADWGEGAVHNRAA